MLSVGACIGYLLTALDWSSLGLSGVGSREQVDLVNYLFCKNKITILSGQHCDGPPPLRCLLPGDHVLCPGAAPPPAKSL